MDNLVDRTPNCPYNMVIHRWERLMLIWDENKRKSNIVKHGIDFADLVHADWSGIVYVGTDVVDFEARDVVLLTLDIRIILTVIVERDDAVRIVSARRATKTEEALFHEF